MTKRHHAVFITGFNNWGKTTIIKSLFPNKNFIKGKIYKMNNKGLNNINFTVETRSNDDMGVVRWRRDYILPKIEKVSNNVNLLTALCPTKVEDVNNKKKPNPTPNDFIYILSNEPFTSYQHLHVFLIKYKWDLHAELMCDNIEKAGRNIPNVNFIRINAKDPNAKYIQIVRELNRILNP